MREIGVVWLKDEKRGVYISGKVNMNMVLVMNEYGWIRNGAVIFWVFEKNKVLYIYIIKCIKY